MRIDKIGLNRLKADEGLRLTPYVDTVGKLTVGYGRNLDDNGLYPDEIIELIGPGISLKFAEKMLENDIEKIERWIELVIPWALTLDSVRYSVIVNMIYNLGPANFLKFQKTIAAIQAGKYDEASSLMLKSLWSKQVGARAQRLAKAMRSGKFS